MSAMGLKVVPALSLLQSSGTWRQIMWSVFMCNAATMGFIPYGPVEDEVFAKLMDSEKM